VQEPVLSRDRHAETGVPVAAARHGPDFRVPRWLVWVTFASIMAPLPSALWRLGLAAGLSMGFSGQRLAGLGVPGWGSLYVVGLSVVSMALALLALGLVRPWGEVVPGWIPLLGGGRVPPPLAVILAGLASIVLTVLTVAGAAG
jgi:hypothetical protein